MIEAASVRGGERLGGRELPTAVTHVFGDLRGRIDGDLLAVCHAANGSVYSIEEGGTLRQWDPSTGYQLRFETLSELESCWAFNPDGRIVASGSTHLSIWDVTSGLLIGRLSEPAWVLTLAFSPDGKLLASGHDDHIVRLWNAETGKLLRELKRHHDEICALAFSADGTKLATAGEDRLVVLWDAASGSIDRELLGHTDRIDALAWTLDGLRIASAGWDTSVRVWNTRNGELLAMLNGQGECVHCVTFSPDGSVLISGDSDGVVRLWDYAGLKVLEEFRRHEGAVKRLALSGDGRYLVSGGSDRSLQFWDLENHRGVAGDTEPLSKVRAIRVAADGLAAALHYEGRLSVWDLSTGETRPTKFPTNVIAMAASPRGPWALGTVDGRIAIYPSVDQPASVVWPGHDNPTTLLNFSPDGKTLASSAGSDGTVKIWDATTAEPVFIIPEATKSCSVESLAFHPSRPLLAVAGIDWISQQETEGVIAIWDLATRQQYRLLDGGGSRIAFSPDGAILAAISLYESIVLWDIENARLVRELPDVDASVSSIAFDPTHRFFAAGSNEGSLRIWETRDWHLLAIFDVETGIEDIAFTPDGQAVITGNGNSSCYRVDLESLTASS